MKTLAVIMEKHLAIFSISLASVDGRSVAHLNRNSMNSPDRIAAMTCSLLGLSESYAREMNRDRCRYSLVAMESGSAVIVRIPTKSLRFALAIGADHTQNIATILRGALDGATELAKTLN